MKQHLSQTTNKQQAVVIHHLVHLMKDINLAFGFCILTLISYSTGHPTHTVLGGPCMTLVKFLFDILQPRSLWQALYSTTEIILGCQLRSSSHPINISH